LVILTEISSLFHLSSVSILLGLPYLCMFVRHNNSCEAAHGSNAKFAISILDAIFKLTVLFTYFSQFPVVSYDFIREINRYIHDEVIGDTYDAEFN
jgi:hypothetical protein